jgi:nucleotide-binding universal stress UspA family protein
MPVDIQTLLVATDFSEASRAATTYAFRLTQTFRAHLYLLHVVPKNDVRLITALSQHLESSIPPTTLTEVFYTEADKRLVQLMEEVQAADIVQERFVVTADPAEAIMSWATAKQMQLINY